MTNKIAIITDTNSCITNKLADELGIFILPMPFIINGISYFENINFTPTEFYKEMRNDSDISTSQPSPADVIELWENVLKDYDSIVHIPMASTLSSSYDTAQMLSNDFKDKVFVVNNKRISVTQKQSVLDAIKLKDKGFNANDIKNKLEENAKNSIIYIAVDTLKHLKKGGRISSTTATIGNMLNIKPILKFDGDKLDSISKARGMKIAEKKLVEYVNYELNNNFKNLENVRISVAYSGDKSIGNEWHNKIKENFPKYNIECDILSLSISCHTGEGTLGVGIYTSL